GERLDDVNGETGEGREFFWRGFPPHFLPEDLARLDDAREVGRAVERHAHRPPLTREGREDRLADPPHRVRDELDALIGVELSGGREQADVAFTDEVDERQSAILVFLGDRNHEAQVALHEFLQRVGIAGADAARDLDLLGALEERVRADLVEVLVENVTLRLTRRDPGGSAAAAAAWFYFGSGRHWCGIPCFRR